MNFYDDLFIPFINNYLEENESTKNIDILKKRYGIDNPRNYTLEEIGIKYSVSRERIRQIESNILRKIRTSLFGDDLPLLNLIADNELVNIVKIHIEYINSKKAFNIDTMRQLIFEDSEYTIQSYIPWENLFLDLIKVTKYKMKTLDNEVVISNELNIKEFQNDLEYTYRYMRKDLIPVTIDDLLIGILKKRKNRDKTYIILAVSCLPIYKKNVDNIDYITLELDDSFSAGDMAYRILWINNEPLTAKEISREINSIIISKGVNKLKNVRNIVNQMSVHKSIIPIGNNKWALKEWNISKKHINQLIQEVLIDNNKPMSKKDIVAAVKTHRKDIKSHSIHAYLSYDNYYQLDDGKVILSDWKRRYSDKIVKRTTHKNYNELFVSAFRYYSKRTLTTHEIWDYIKLEFTGNIYDLRNMLLRKNTFISHKKLDGVDYWTLFDNYISIINQLHGNKKKYVRSVAIDILNDNDGSMFLNDLIERILHKIDCNDRTIYQVLSEKGIFTKTVVDQNSYVTLANSKQLS